MKKIMRRLLVGASAMALVIGLSSCGGENEPANEVASENDMNAMMADATNPFSQSEMAMDQAIGIKGSHGRAFADGLYLVER